MAVAAAAAARRAGMVDDAVDAPSNTTVAQWQAAMRSMARAQPVTAAAEDEHASRRPIMLTLDDVKHHDFSCPDLPKALASGVPAACQVKCGEPPCVPAYQQCLAQPRCLAVHVNFDKTWGTLKTSVQDGQEIVVVLSEAEWKVQLQAEVFKRKRSPGSRVGAPYWQLANEKHRRAAAHSGPLSRLLGFS